MKNARADEQYFERRREFAHQIGFPSLYEFVDHWPLYVGTGNLARVLAISELFLQTQEVPGDVAEFGVWKGATSSLLAKLLAIRAPLSSKKIHLFDSFKGLTEFAAEDSVARARVGDYSGSEETLRDAARVNEVDEYFVFHKGLIEDSLPRYVMESPHTLFSFIYCDTDLFSSTSLILQTLWSRVSPGGIMVFDQWNMDEFPGEGTAVNLFIEKFRNELVLISPAFTRQPTLAIRKKEVQ